MNEKSSIEKNAARKQAGLLIQALTGAGDADRYWLNPSGKLLPKFYPKGVSVSPFNALVMALDSDAKGCKTNLYTLFSEAKQRGEPVQEHEKGAPFLFYNWNRYVNRNNPEDVIDRKTYQQLSKEEKERYKGIHNREVRTVFNIDQTILPMTDKQSYADLLKRDGGAEERGQGRSDSRKLHIRVNDFLLKMRDNLVPVRMDGSGVAHYESTKDAVYVPRQKDFEHYHDYVQEVFRQVVSATGHQQRLAREGMVMKEGTAPSESAVRQERLIVELASGVKMLELGLPARLSAESMALTDYWARELKENPRLIDIVESEVNNALDVIHKAERGEKIEYATHRNRRETDRMEKEQPLHHFIADEIARYPDKEKKIFVVVKDGDGKNADVILPAGASPEADNELPGMSKQRIRNILGKDGIENVTFYNPDGAWGYRPDDAAFEDRQVTVARLRNWSMETLSTLDVSEAVKRSRTVNFEQVQMIQDDEKRWALYIKPEGKAGYSVYPDKDDLNRFFTTLKQAMQNISAVRGELANKYYLMAESHPELKTDLFSTPVQDIDLNKIERVSVYKTRQDGIQCAVTINGEKLPPRSVTPQQWQRMWVADDPVKYKKHLAATLFADVLRQGQAEEKTADEKLDEDNQRRQGNGTSAGQTDGISKGDGPSRSWFSTRDIPESQYERYKQLKEEQPEAIVLLKKEGIYYASLYDAETIANELGLPPEKERIPYEPDRIIPVFEYDNGQTIQQIRKLQAYVIECDTVSKKQDKNAVTAVGLDKNRQPENGKKVSDIRQTDPSILEQWERLKEKHPDAVLLFRKDDSYEAYKEDAGKVGKILGMEAKKTETADGRNMETLAFPSKDLDVFLPKLIRAGCRVAICDQIEPKKEQHQERQKEQFLGMKR